MTAPDTSSHSATPLTQPVYSEVQTEIKIQETETLETLALDQHQERWSLALLPLITAMIVMAGAAFLYVLIDLGSASHLALEPQTAILPVKSLAVSDARAPENTNRAASPLKNSAEKSPQALAAPPATPPDKQGNGTAASSEDASKTAGDASVMTSQGTVANAPAYPLLQADDVREPFTLAHALVQNATSWQAASGLDAMPLSSYLWNHFDEQTRFRLRHVQDVEVTWPPAAALIHSQAASQLTDDITSPARLKALLMEALNKQLDDEAIAIRYQPDRWLAEARRVMEQKGEPEFHLEQIKNPLRLARRIKDIPAGKFSPALQRRIAALSENPAAQGKPDFSSQEIAAGKQALAAKLNVLLYGDSLCRQPGFSRACSSLPALLKPPVRPASAPEPTLARGSPRGRQRMPPPSSAEADTTLLANRVILEQTYANYLSKAEPAVPQDRLRRINRASLLHLYASLLRDSPDPAPTADVVAERQSGRLAWFTYVGLNFAVCLCVFLAAGGIILATAQTRYRQTAVPRVKRNEVDFKQLLALLQQNSPPFHPHLFKLMKARYCDLLLKQPLERCDELPRSLQDNLVRGLNRLLAGFSFANNAKLPLTWKQRMRESLPFVHASTEHSVEVYRNLRQIIEIDPAWIMYSNAQKQQIRERFAALEKQSRMPPNHRWLLSWLLLGLSGVFIMMIMQFSIDKGTLGEFLAITAQRDMPYLNYLLALFEKVELTATALLALATCMVLMPPSEEDKEALKRRARSLFGPDPQQNLDDEVALWYAGKMQNLRTILYISTAVLASAVLQVSFTYSWALTYLPYPHGDVYKQFELLSRTIVTGRGIYYSLLLAAIYVPATSVLRSLTTILAEEAWRHRAKAQKIQEVQDSGMQSSGIKSATAVLPSPTITPSPTIPPAPVTPAPISWIRRMALAWKIRRRGKKQDSTAAPIAASPLSGMPAREGNGKPATEASGKTQPVPSVPLDNTLDSREQWLKARALASETWEMLPRFTAVILPLLTGPAAEIIKSLIPSIGSK